MPAEDKNFGGALVLDFRKRWRHVKTIYCQLTVSPISTLMKALVLTNSLKLSVLANFH